MIDRNALLQTYLYEYYMVFKSLSLRMNLFHFWLSSFAFPDSSKIYSSVYNFLFYAALLHIGSFYLRGPLSSNPAHTLLIPGESRVYLLLCDCVV